MQSTRRSIIVVYRYSCRAYWRMVQPSLMGLVRWGVRWANTGVLPSGLLLVDTYAFRNPV